MKKILMLILFISIQVAAQYESIFTGSEMDALLSQIENGDTLSFPVSALDSLMNGMNGGSTGQVPRKKSNARFDFEFYTPTAGGDTTHYSLISQVIGLQDSIDALQAQIESILNEGDPRIPYLWAFHAPLDTTATDPNIPDSSGAALSTVISSYAADINNQDVGRFYNISSGEFRLYHPTSGWTSWLTNTASNSYYSKADSIQVRDTSSASNSTAVNAIIYIAGVVDTFIITTLSAGGSSHITDSLKLYWDFADIANGSVDEWFDAIANYRTQPFGGDTANRPIKTGTDLIFDGTDFLRGTTGGGSIPSFAGSPMTAYVICDLQDTATTQLIFGANNSRELTVGVVSNRIYAYGFNGSTTYWTNCYSTSFLGKHVIAVTWDGSSAPDVYLDGTLQADVGDVEGVVLAETRAYIGGNGTNNVVSGTSIPLAMVYNVEHNSTQVSTNTNSTTFQDLIP